jgi:hypothetical protein
LAGSRVLAKERRNHPRRTFALPSLDRVDPIALPRTPDAFVHTDTSTHRRSPVLLFESSQRGRRRRLARVQARPGDLPHALLDVDAIEEGNRLRLAIEERQGNL